MYILARKLYVCAMFPFHPGGFGGPQLYVLGGKTYINRRRSPVRPGARCVNPSGLNRIQNPSNWSSMKIYFDIKDRTRLRERFFGATHTVLARL